MSKPLTGEAFGTAICWGVFNVSIIVVTCYLVETYIRGRVYEPTYGFLGLYFLYSVGSKLRK